MRDVLQRLRSELGGLLAGSAAPGSVGADQLVAFVRAATESIANICGSTTHQTGGLDGGPRGSVVSPSAALAVAAALDVPVVDTPAKVDGMSLMATHQTNAVPTAGIDALGQHMPTGTRVLSLCATFNLATVYRTSCATLADGREQRDAVHAVRGASQRRPRHNTGRHPRWHGWHAWTSSFCRTCTASATASHHVYRCADARRGGCAGAHGVECPGLAS